MFSVAFICKCYAKYKLSKDFSTEFNFEKLQKQLNLGRRILPKNISFYKAGVIAQPNSWINAESYAWRSWNYVTFVLSLTIVTAILLY